MKTEIVIDTHTHTHYYGSEIGRHGLYEEVCDALLAWLNKSAREQNT